MSDTTSAPRPTPSTPSGPGIGSIEEDGSIGLSLAELRILLRFVPDEQAVVLRTLMRVVEPEAADEELDLVDQAAISGLVARGFLTFDVEQDSLVPDREALVLVATLHRAEAWSTLEVSDGGAGGDWAFLVESPLGKCFLQPRAYDTWWFVLLDPTVPGSELVRETAVGLALGAARTAVFARVLRPDLDRTLTIHQQSGVWSFAFGDTGEGEPDERVEGVDRAGLDAGFERFFATIPVVVPVAGSAP